MSGIGGDIFLVLDTVKSNWNFLEVWIDAMQSPPYILLLLGDEAGVYHIFDPAVNYGLVTSCQSYDEAKLWLLEDEYEPLEGRRLERITALF